jgi:hypothetical protein
MSARTRKNSASPPTMSIVSGEVASSRERPGSAGAAVFVTFGSGCFVFLGLGFAAPRPRTRLSRCTEAGGGWDTTRVTTCAGGGVTAAGGGAVGGGWEAGGGGGVARVAGVSDCRFALGGASGLGPDEFGGAGSGAGSCASA